MERTIYAEQVLHGYANGHQLLASSYVLELSDRKKMDELSDLSGRHNGEDFVDYYTGYPIEDGRKYVISKTWYAHEMMRPGCVWTHSLIFCTEQLRQLSDISGLMDSFCRPANLNYETYTHPVAFFIGERKNFPSYDIQWLQYEIFTICSSAVPKCVLVDTDSVRLENKLFMVLCGLPPEILRTFTFCTMSYDVRRYGDSIFKYQIFSETGRNNMDRNICFVLIRKNPELLLCPDIWQQTKDFQQEMVCAINRSLELKKLEKLLVIVSRPVSSRFPPLSAGFPPFPPPIPLCPGFSNILSGYKSLPRYFI